MILFFGFLFSLFTPKFSDGGSDDEEWEFQGDDELGKYYMRNLDLYNDEEV